MINDIFITLSKALEAGSLLALAAAFGWGVLSILLSPCHLASIPLVVGFVSVQKDKKTKKAFFISFMFALGILLTILIVGFITGLLGRMLGDLGLMAKIGNIIVAVVLLIVAAYMLGLISLDFLQVGNKPALQRKGEGTAFLMGLIFGISVGPCTFAYMAPMLAFTFKSAANNMFFAIILLVAFAIGHSLVIILAGGFSNIVQRYLNWNEKSKGLTIIKKICGVLLIAAAVYIITQ